MSKARIAGIVIVAVFITIIVMIYLLTRPKPRPGAKVIQIMWVRLRDAVDDAPLTTFDIKVKNEGTWQQVPVNQFGLAAFTIITNTPIWISPIETDPNPPNYSPLPDIPIPVYIDVGVQNVITIRLSRI